MEPLGQLQPRRPTPWEHEFLPAKRPFTASFDLDANVKSSMLCSLCWVIQSWLQANWDSLQIIRQDFEQSFDHCDTGLKLHESFLDGCHLCTLIWHSFDPTSTYPLQNRLVRRERAIPRVLNAKNLKLSIYNKGTSGPTLRPYLTTSEKEVIQSESIRLSCHRLVKQPLSSSTICTSSGAVRRLSERWIQECMTSHTKCKQQRTSILPGRIIQVVSDTSADDFRIVDTTSLPSGIRYAALSYCWGNGPQFKLTSHTLDEFMSGVAVQRFPATIRDAVEFIRSIGLKWLWVDSLCILQDCLDDWNRESSKMCDVYQNSFLTLAALAASDSDGGLFALRDPLLYLSCELFKTTTGETVCADRHDARLGLGTWPLHQRRWVLQERILSPRTLNFGPYMVWQCRESLLDEYSLLQRSVFLTIGADLCRMFFEAMENKKKLNHSLSETNDAILFVWGHILAAYSNAALTIQSDNLKAISGVITVIENHTGWKNLAGLWEPFLWRELLWKRVTSNPDQSTGLSPTWSWISISDVFMQHPDDEPLEGFFLHPISSVKEAETMEMNDSERFESQMALHVSCIPARIGRTFEVRDTGRTCVDLINWPWGGQAIHEPDSASAERGPELFLPLAAGNWIQFGWEIYGLAIIPSATFPGAFERVGYMSVRSDDAECLSDEAYTMFLDPSRWETLTLV